MPKLHVIICSTRPTRKGPAVAKWFQQFALAHGKFEVELVDLAAFDLPVFDEPEHPATQKYQHEHTKKWAASVDAADAYVFVTPEYNHSMPPSFYNALSYLFREWGYKPCTFVGYAYLDAGLRAVADGQKYVATFRMVPIVETVAVPFFTNKIDGDGVFLSDEKLDKDAKAALDELHRWAEALKPLHFPLPRGEAA